MEEGICIAIEGIGAEDKGWEIGWDGNECMGEVLIVSCSYRLMFRDTVGAVWVLPAPHVQRSRAASGTRDSKLVSTHVQGFELVSWTELWVELWNALRPESDGHLSRANSPTSF